MSPGEREGQAAQSTADPLDVANGRDVGLLYEALRRGWQVTETRKRAYFAALDQIIRDPDSDPKVKAQAAKCLLMEQQMMLKHAHKVMDDVRLDSGKLTGRVEISALAEAAQRYREANVPEDRWPTVVRDYARSASADGNRN